MCFPRLSHHRGEIDQRSASGQVQSIVGPTPVSMVETAPTQVTASTALALRPTMGESVNCEALQCQKRSQRSNQVGPHKLRRLHLRGGAWLRGLNHVMPPWLLLQCFVQLMVQQLVTSCAHPPTTPSPAHACRDLNCRVTDGAACLKV